MEIRALVAKALLTRGQCTEIFRSLRHCLAIQAHHYSSQWLTAMLDIKVDLFDSISSSYNGYNFVNWYLMGDLRSLGRRGSLGKEEEGGSQDE